LAWAINYTETAKRELKKLDKPAARRILDFLDNRVAKQDDPRQLGKALSGPLGTLWRYRIGDYRVICEIQHQTVTVLVLRVGHRREVYR
jgi:mRNA interferase RelE/StbE